MERASRIVSILLGLGVTVLLWPVAVPLGFGEVWWASQKAQWQSDAKPLPRGRRHRSRSPRLPRLRRKPRLPCRRTPAPQVQLPAPHRVSADATCGGNKTPPRQSRLNRRRPTPRLGKLPP